MKCFIQHVRVINQFNYLTTVSIMFINAKTSKHIMHTIVYKCSYFYLIFGATY